MPHFFKKSSSRIILGVSVLVILCLIWWFGLRSAPSMFAALPSQTTIALSFSGINQLDSLSKQASTSLSSLSIVDSCKQDAKQALELFSEAPDLQALFLTNSIVAGFSLQPTDSLHPLFVLDLKYSTKASALLAGLSSGTKAFPSVFKGHKLYTIQNANGEELVVTTIHNFLLFSRYSLLVEDALLQMGQRKQWWTAQAFPGEASESPCRLIIRPEMLEKRCMGLLSAQWQYLPAWLSSKVEWVECYLDKPNWRFNVGPQSPGSASHYQSAETDALQTILPDNTAFFAKIQSEKFRQMCAQSGDVCSDFQNHLLPWLGQETAFVLTAPYSDGMQEDQFLICAIQDEQLARQNLKSYGDQTGFLKKHSYQTFEIEQFLSPSLLEPMLGENAEAFRNPACVFLNGYAVFASSTAALEMWIDKYVVSQTLSNYPDFLMLQQQLAETPGAMAYLNTDYLPLILKQLFQPAFLARHADAISKTKGIGLIAVSLAEKPKGRFSGSIAVQARSQTSSSASVLWKMGLDDDAISQPFRAVLNEADTDPAYLIQDKRFQIYRFDENGRVFWRKQLNQAIISDVKAIDFYNNGQRCFLFNTPDAIWILDDEGREISGYPLSLKSPATNGVCLVDFHGNNKYSFFVACANGNLYGFDQFGRPLNGWNPQSGVGRIRHPLIYFKHDTRDFLAVLSLGGQLSVFDRRGELHFPRLQFEGSFFVSPPQVDTSAAAARIVCANTAGLAFICNIKGESFALELGDAKNKEEACLVFERLFGDDRRDYALLKGAEVYLAGYEEKTFVQKYTVNLTAKQDTIFNAGCCQKVGSLDREKRQIFLINATGAVHPGFPLAGTTPFNLRKLMAGQEEYLLVVGNESSVYAYKVQ